MSKSELRFALIGYGAWGRCHAEAIAKAPGAELAAVAETNEQARADALEQFPGAVVVDDYRSLVARDDIDVVDIVLPSFLHHEVASAFLEAGKHLMLEKPMCLSVEQCDDLIATAREKNLVLAINHEFRLSSLWGKVKELVDEGVLGEPQYALVELSRNPYRLGSDGWRFDINRVGNWILEEPIHFFDLARWYLEPAGEPQTVYAAASSRQRDHPELQDNFSAIMHFEKNAYAVVSQTLSAFEHHQMVKLTGSRGALWASWAGAMDRTRDATHALRVFDGQKVEDVPIELSTGELFELEEHLATLVRTISDGASLPCTGDDGRWSVAMCLAAAESVERGQPVPISKGAS
jgi:myo-inositol 2-dehydrogenase/D-chiro-inositol 1-dehydrogenase